MPSNRRQWLKWSGIAAGAAAVGHEADAPAQDYGVQAQKARGDLPLVEFQPKSMLHVHESRVPRARFPVIDVHAHLAWSSRNGTGAAKLLAPPAELLKVMDAKNIRTLVHLTGGFGEQLKENIKLLQTAHPGRFYVFTEPMWSFANQPGYAKRQADELERAKQAGARGVKVLKTLGLYLRENITSGPLVKIDDPRFDPMWEACGALNMPVNIHVADPEAFFLPIDRFNERYEELHNHPDWSFYGKDFPSFAELMAARNRVFARHPKTKFIVLHVGNDAENLGAVGEWMDKYPNMFVEIGARIGELGRQPRTARKFFDRYQDRIMFGTDAVPGGIETPQQIYNEQLYEIYYRFLETEDEYFDYAPAPVPPQGRWRIYGLGLPESILKKVYNGNASRVIGI